MRFEYTKKMVEKVLDEVDRRMEMDISNRYYGTQQEIEDALREKRQGAYGAMMVTASNWPTVVDWIDEIDESSRS